MAKEKRLIEIPSDGIVRIPIMRGEDTVGEKQIDLSSCPTVDAVEVVHAEWTLVIDENDCECIECPLCGEQFYDGDNDTFDKPWNYCPNCGAKMDGDGNG